MASDLISREDLKTHIRSLTGMFTDDGFYVSIDAVLGAIDFAPTVDAEPVRHGEWIDSTVCVGFYECSQCRSRKRGNQPFFDNVWNYCPNCGAKMNGGKQDEIV